MSDWPVWATQPVEIEEWSPSWAQVAEELIGDLARRLEPWAAGPVEHVGSTAVRGLSAKPIVDLLAPVRSLSEAKAADDVLAVAGWHLVPPEVDQRPWRRMFVLPEHDRRVAHLHLVESGHERVRDTLTFRDHLREQPEAASAYARLKSAAAEQHRDDREAYTSAKTEFVRSIVADVIRRGPR